MANLSYETSDICSRLLHVYAKIANISGLEYTICITDASRREKRVYIVNSTVP